jgi:exonuclease SbcC
LGFGYNSEHKRWLVESFGVDLQIELGGCGYLIERHRYQKKGGYLKVTQSGGAEWVVEGVREAQEVINKIMGMDYEAFVSSVIMRQDDYEAFMKMSPGAAKEVLMKIIGIGQFEDKREAAAEKAKELAIKIVGLETAIGLNEQQLQDTKSHEHEIARLDLREAAIHKEIEAKQNECDSSEANFQKMKADLAKFNDSLEQIMVIKRELDPMGPMITKKENELDRLIHDSGMKVEEILQSKPEDWQQDIVFTEQNVKEKEKRMGELRDQVVQGDTMLRTYRKQLQELMDNPQKCLLGKEECDGTLTQQCKGKTDEITKTGVALKAELEKVTIEQDQIGAGLEKERLILKQSRAAYTVACDWPMLVTWKETKERGQANKERLESYLIENQGSTQEDATALEFEIKGYKNGIKKLQDERGDIQREKGKIEERKSAWEKMSKDTEKMKQMLPAQKDKLFIYETLKKALSKDGIPALMIETVVPQLEAHANELLDKLSGGQIKVEFRLQKKLKSGGFSDSFEIYVTDPDGTRSVAMYSGGEKYRIILAIHSAFSRYLIHRSGTPLKFLCIDEPTGLDDQGIERFVETLGGLREGYEQIFVITHLKSLVEYFPQTLMVNKTDSGSVVTAFGMEKVENNGGKKLVTSYDL